MFVNILILLVLVFVVVSALLLARFISSITRRDRELNRIRDERNLNLFKRIQVISEQILKTEELIIDFQINLDKNINALGRIIDDHISYVTNQQEQFIALTKSDMLVARRDELIRLKELKVALERIMSMAIMSRQSPSSVDVIAFESVTNRIAELETILEISRIGK